MSTKPSTEHIPKRRSQEERRLATRRKLVSSATATIADLGISGTTVPNIARRAGVTTGAVQHHFGDREGLLIAVVGDFADAMRRRMVGETINPTTSVEERVKAICAEMWDVFATDQFIASIEILIALRHDQRSYPLIQALVSDIERELDRIWVAHFEDPNISADILRALRHLMQATFRGLVIRRIYSNRMETWATERALLEKMLIAFLTGEQGGRGSSADPV